MRERARAHCGANEGQGVPEGKEVLSGDKDGAVVVASLVGVDIKEGVERAEDEGRLHSILGRFRREGH